MIIKYKLIKEYPGSPSFGTIIDYDTFGTNEYQVIGESEYWLEIKKSNFTIISFMNYDTKIYLHSNGFYSWNDTTDQEVTADHMLNLSSVTIHSVRRNSDGALFTIGDITKYADSNDFEITKFDIDYKRNPLDIIVYRKACAECVLDRSIYHINIKPIFITNGDNVPIFKDQPFWFCSNRESKWDMIYVPCANSSSGTGSGFDNVAYIYFSTEEGARNYCKEHNKIVIFYDYNNNPIYNDTYFWFVYGNGGYMSGPVNVRTDVPVNPDLFYFSTEKAAKKFYDYLNRKSLFKTADGVNMYGGEDVWYVYNSKDSYTQLSPVNVNTPHENRDELSRIFSTEQACKDYIKKQKVVFITIDGINKHIGDPFYIITNQWEIHQKTADPNNIWYNFYINRCFHNWELAEDYVIKNKPVLLTLNEIAYNPCINISETDKYKYRKLVQSKQ